MKNHITFMIIPAQQGPGSGETKTFHIPRPAFRAMTVFATLSICLLGLMAYDYWKVMGEVYRNRHLSLENNQLREQIQLFQMKVNTLENDLQRIHVFEKKLRVLSGLRPVSPGAIIKEGDTTQTRSTAPKSEDFTPPEFKDLKNIDLHPQFQGLKRLHESKIAKSFGEEKTFQWARNWSQLVDQSFKLANKYARFDFAFGIIRKTSERLEQGLHEIDQYFLERKSRLQSTPTLLPAKGWITDYYGPRKSPYSNRLKMHEGLDIGARRGTPIVAPADGVVTYSGRRPDFGNIVQINHGYGVETIYAHAQSRNVSKGETVQRGQLIAKVGSTGLSTGPHLHYEIRVNGTPVDPLYFILD